jgi:hypothetical protein
MDSSTLFVLIMLVAALIVVAVAWRARALVLSLSPLRLDHVLNAPNPPPPRASRRAHSDFDFDPMRRHGSATRSFKVFAGKFSPLLIRCRQGRLTRGDEAPISRQ